MPVRVRRLVKKLANWGRVGFCPSVIRVERQYGRIMRFLAVANSATPAASTLERLKGVPPEFWLRLVFAIVAVIALVVFLRKVAKMNKVVLAVVSFIVVTVVGFNWVYERSEPAWATPMVGFLANWFPTKGPPAKTPASSLAQKH
jgi:hypothetical protein